MKLTVIGSTGSMSGPASSSSSYLVQARGFDPDLGEDRLWSVVLDMGPGSFGQLWRHIDPGDVDALLITHGHADHIADVISYYVFLKWHPNGHRKPLLTAGPEEVFGRIQQIDGYAAVEDLEACFNFVPIHAGSTLNIGPMQVTAFPGLHPVESYGFRIEGPSESGEEEVTLAYTGDTDLCESMEEMAANVDLLLAECGFTDDVPTRGIHLSGTRAGILASSAHARRLVLTHIQPWTDPSVPTAEAAREHSGLIEVATAGAVWEL